MGHATRLLVLAFARLAGLGSTVIRFDARTIAMGKACAWKGSACVILPSLVQHVSSYGVREIALGTGFASKGTASAWQVGQAPPVLSHIQTTRFLPRLSSNSRSVFLSYEAWLLWMPPHCASLQWLAALTAAQGTASAHQTLFAHATRDSPVWIVQQNVLDSALAMEFVLLGRASAMRASPAPTALMSAAAVVMGLAPMSLGNLWIGACAIEDGQALNATLSWSVHTPPAMGEVPA
mmetsp:Transcript_54455/g.129769  ORF Transcript_54455/g.129769 Transcript_54455/m.129769 type:complete len:236 (+) Transcript_54455:644-1351(+)